MSIRVIKRRVVISRAYPELDAEFAAARWVYNRLLDFEFEHQRMMDACAPKLAQVGRILRRLSRRKRWAERAREGAWRPGLRLELKARMEAMKAELKAERAESPEWEAAKKWPKDVMGEKQCRRKDGETDEDFAKRKAERGGRSRRDTHGLEVYAEKRCYWSTFNAQKKSVEQAVKKVLTERAAGNSAQLRRARVSDPGRLTIQASQGGFQLLQNDGKRLKMRLRINEGWVELQTSGRGKLQQLPPDFQIRVVELVRERFGLGYKYWVCLTVAGDWKRSAPGPGVVGIDTGHREMPDGQVRAFAWYGSDGQSGEVRLPQECVQQIEHSYALQAATDNEFLKWQTVALETGALHRKFRDRHEYSRYLMTLGVRTEEQSAWLSWERHQGMRIMKAKRRARCLRQETYIKAARMLRESYGKMGIDVVGSSVQRLQQYEMVKREIRQKRDLVAAYSIKQLLMQYGVEEMNVPGKKSSMQCPLCGEEHKTGSKLMRKCPAKGIEFDQDYGAAYVMMARAVNALGARQAAAE